ncbi:MAG: V-type ATP synthase subunit E [Caulobacteraceae bacterium]
MAGVEKIKEKILQDAENKANEILEKARLQAKEIVENGKQKAARKGREISQKALHDANEKKRIINSIVELEMRKDVLAAKQEVIDNVFNVVLQRMNNMEKGRYERVVLNMLLEAVETGDEEIVLSQTAKEKLSPDFITKVNSSLEAAGKNGNIKVSEEVRNISGGFVLKSQGIEINNSFEAIIRQHRDEIEPKVAGILF